MVEPGWRAEVSENAYVMMTRTEVASRGHHADVGGIAPGSMTPRATTVDEEAC